MTFTAPSLLALAAASSEPDLARYLVVSGALLGALVLGAFLVRRMAGGVLAERAGKRGMQVLDALPLGGRKRAVIVRCHDRTFLLGVGEKEVCSIAELDAEAVAVDQARERTGGAGRSGFAALLGGAADDVLQPQQAGAEREREARQKVAAELLEKLAEQRGERPVRPARGERVADLISRGGVLG
jgi:flagellar biogenesis protein FliO